MCDQFYQFMELYPKSRKEHLYSQNSSFQPVDAQFLNYNIAHVYIHVQGIYIIGMVTHGLNCVSILHFDCIEHKGCMSKFNTFEKNEFQTSNAPEKYKTVTKSLIHSGHFYSAPSSPLQLTGAADYSTDTVSEFHAEAHRNLQVKDLPKIPTWRLERESNPRPWEHSEGEREQDKLFLDFIEASFMQQHVMEPT